MTLIATILNFLFGWALKAWQNRGPAPIVVESEKAGAATEAAQTDVASVKTEAAIAQAEAEAPATQAEDVAAFKAGTV